MMQLDKYNKRKFDLTYEGLTSSIANIDKDFIPAFQSVFNKYNTPSIQISYKRLKKMSNGRSLGITFSVKDFEFEKELSIKVSNFIPTFFSQLKAIFEATSVSDLYRKTLFGEKVIEDLVERKEFFKKCEKDLKKDLALPLFTFSKQEKEWLSYLRSEDSFKKLMRFAKTEEGDYAIPYAVSQDVHIESFSDVDFLEKYTTKKNASWEIINPNARKVKRKDGSSYYAPFLYLDPFISKEFEAVLNLVESP